MIPRSQVFPFFFSLSFPGLSSNSQPTLLLFFYLPPLIFPFFLLHVNLLLGKKGRRSRQATTVPLPSSSSSPGDKLFASRPTYLLPASLTTSQLSPSLFFPLWVPEPVRYPSFGHKGSRRLARMPPFPPKQKYLVSFLSSVDGARSDFLFFLPSFRTMPLQSHPRAKKVLPEVASHCIDKKASLSPPSLLFSLA